MIKPIIIGLIVFVIGALTTVLKPTTTPTTTITTSQPATAIKTAPSKLTIHISGAVKKPGLYHLSKPIRAKDALTLAGGPLPSANLDKLNLAAMLTDGKRLHIREKKTKKPNSKKQKKPANFSIQTATKAQLISLPGIGPKLADRIIAYRQTHPITSIDELIHVKGIGKKSIARIHATRRP